MKWLQFARKHWAQSLRRYGTYTLSLGAIIFVVFVFQSVASHPLLSAGITARMNVSIAFGIFSMILGGLGILYAWYANSFFMKRRAPELGLLALLGLSRTALMLWFLAEGFLSALVALAIGLGAGMLFGPFSFLVLERLMAGAMPVSFQLAPVAFAASALTALGLMLIHVLSGLAMVLRTRLIALFKARRSPERPARGNVILGLLGVSMIALGYYFSTITTTRSFVDLALWIIGLCVVGTFLAVRHALAIALDLLRRRPLEKRRGVALVALAQLSFRLKKNARMLSMVAVLSATTIAGLGTAFYTYTVADDSLDAMSPIPVQMVDAPADERAVFEAVLARDPGLERGTIREYKARAWFNQDTDWHDVLVVPATAARAWALLSRSTFADPAPGSVVLSRAVGPGIETESVQTIRMEAASVDETGLPDQTEGGRDAVEQVAEVRFEVRVSATIPLINNGAGTHMRDLLILNDADFSSLLAAGIVDGSQSLMFHGYRPADLAVENEVADKLAQRVMAIADGNVNDLPGWIDSRAMSRRLVYSLMGVILFIAGFMSLVLLMASGSMMSFKQTMDLEDDAARYRMLWNLGFTDRQVRSVFLIQLGLFFGLPYILGVSHGIFALNLLGRFMGVPIGWHIMVVCVVYGLLFGVYFASVLRSGLRISRRSTTLGFGV